VIILLYCEKCGTLNDDESFFCSSCGIDLPRSKSEPIVFGKVPVDEVSSPSIEHSFHPPVKPPVKPSPPLMHRFEFSKRFFSVSVISFYLPRRMRNLKLFFQ